VLAGITRCVLQGAGRKIRAASALFALALLAIATHATAASAAAPDDFFGVNGQNVFRAPQSQWDGELAAMAAGGLQVVRRDASWNSVEQNAPDPATGQHTYNWSQLDTQVAAMARHGLRWYPILDYSAPWATLTGNAFSAPARAGDYVAWSAALAARYGRGGSFWQAHPELPQLPVTAYEVWNEENTKYFWHEQANAPEAYADLYMATRAALRQVDPAARIVIGGIALANTDVTDESTFVRRMFAHRPDLRGNVDAVGFHPYAPDANGVELKIKEFRQTLDSVGAAGVPIEITEVGWPTPQVSEPTRAADLQQLAEDLPRSDCDISRFLPHTWVEQPSSNGSFGIMTDDGVTPKPSGAAYLDAARQMRGLTPGAPSGTLHLCYPGGAPAAPAAPAQKRSRGPRLQLRVVRTRHHPTRITLVARCPRGCRLQVDLVRPSRPAGAATVRLVHRATRFTTKRQRMHLRTRVRRGRVRLSVLAVDRAGHRTTRTRTIRIR
jgi:hypothetical protein